jgi:hypothetical protein
MRRRIPLLVLSGLILMAAHALAQENPYFPTTSGSFWNYVGPGGSTVSTTVIGSEAFHGETVIRIDQLTDRGYRADLVSYKYVLDAAGDVYLAGLALPQSLQDLNSVFSPFMLELPAAAELQHSWQDAFTDSTYFGDEFVYELQQSVVHVYEANEEVTVPAGTFQTLRISTQWNGGSTAVSWYSAGIGVVQFVDSIGHTFELTDYQVETVSTEATSWGSLKSLYRN